MENWDFDLHIFNPTTIAHLQVVEEKRGVYSWEGNEFIDFFKIVGGNFWVGKRKNL